MQDTRIIIQPLLVTIGILFIPFLGNMFVDGWNWTWTTFAFFGVVLFGAGLTYELAGKYAKTGVISGFIFGEIVAGGVIATLRYLNPNEDVAGVVIISFLISGLFFAFVGYLIQKYFYIKMKPRGKIGVFDSGLGGLTILKEIMRAIPDREYLYLGDNLHMPYGNKSREEIYVLTLSGVEWLFRNGAEIVILACNTASANALRRIQQEVLPAKYPEKKVLGIIIPTIEEIETFTNSGHIGVLATEATVASGIFEIEMKKKNPHIQILSQTGGRLASYIENDEKKEVLTEEIRRVTNNLLLKDPLIDTLVLGCTHYPLIEKHIQENIPEGIRIISQGDIVAHKLTDYLDRHQELTSCLSKQPSVHFFTTSADVHTQNMMMKFYGEDLHIQVVEI